MHRPFVTTESKQGYVSEGVVKFVNKEVVRLAVITSTKFRGIN